MKPNTIKPLIVLSVCFLAAFTIFGCAKPEEELKSVTQLLREVNDPDPKMRADAARELYWVGTIKEDVPDYEAKKDEIISRLRRLLNDTEIQVRFEAADALMKIDSSGSRDIVIPLILKYADDINPEIRRPAVKKLYYYSDKLGTKEEEVIIVLKKRLTDENAQVRYNAAIALGDIDPRRFQNIIVPTLIEFAEPLEHGYEAAMLAKEIGPAAKPMVPALIRLSRMNKQPKFPSVYTNALKSIGTPEALEAVKEAERADKTWHLRGVILNCAIILCFVLLFGWSVKLRKRSKKVFHWFLLAPIAIYFVVLMYNLQGDSSAVEMVLDIKFFLILASIGCVPWLISWFILRRRESLGVSGRE